MKFREFIAHNTDELKVEIKKIKEDDNLTKEQKVRIIKVCEAVQTVIETLDKIIYKHAEELDYDEMTTFYVNLNLSLIQTILATLSNRMRKIGISREQCVEFYTQSISTILKEKGFLCNISVNHHFDGKL